MITQDLIDELVSYATEKNVSLTFWLGTSKYDIDTSDNKCPWPFSRVYISSDKRVVPCCIMKSETYRPTSREVTLNDVWNSQNMFNLEASPRWLNSRYANILKIPNLLQ